MRVSPGDLRSGLIDSGYAIPSERPRMVGTHSQTTRAVRVFHTDGEAASVAYIDDTFSGPSWASGANATKARIAKQSFSNYRDRANADPRPAAVGEPRATIEVAGHTIAAGCDVVLLEPAGGHTGRLCLWSVIPRPFTTDELELLACPVVLALGNELGQDAVAGLEFYMLRDNVTALVAAERALARIPELNTLVRRLTQS